MTRPRKLVQTALECLAILYIIRRRAKGHIGRERIEVGVGDIVVISAGKAHHHKLEKIGTEPATPPFRQYDMFWGAT